MNLWIAIYIYFLWCVVNVAVAAEKGRMNALVFFGSILATPFTVYLYLLAVPALEVKKTETRQPNTPKPKQKNAPKQPSPYDLT